MWLLSCLFVRLIKTDVIGRLAHDGVPHVLIEADDTNTALCFPCNLTLEKLRSTGEVII